MYVYSLAHTHPHTRTHRLMSETEGFPEEDACRAYTFSELRFTTVRACIGSIDLARPFFFSLTGASFRYYIAVVARGNIDFINFGADGN